MSLNIKIGDVAYFSRTISESDIYNFATITGDNNMLSMNELYYKAQGYEKNIVQNSYLLGLISATLGAKMPGFGTIYLGQETDFLSPVFVGDTIAIKSAVISIVDKTKFFIAKLAIECINQHEEVVAKGVATVIPPEV